MDPYEATVTETVSALADIGVRVSREAASTLTDRLTIHAASLSMPERLDVFLEAAEHVDEPPVRHLVAV